MHFNSFNLVIYLSTITISLVLGAIVLQRNYQKPINRLFSLYIFSLNFWIISNFLADSFLSPTTALFWTKLSLVGPILVATIFLHLSYVFPKGQMDNKTNFLIWIAPIILFILVPTDLNIRKIIIHDWGTEFVPGPLYIPFALLSTIYTTLATKKFITKMSNSSTLIREQIKLIIFGAIPTLIIGIIVAVVLPLLGYSRWAIIAPSTTLILFSSIGYAIVKHQFLDINHLIIRTIVFVTSTILITIIYTTLIFKTIEQLPSNLHQILTIIASLLITLTYPYLKTSLELATKNIFFRQPYNSKKLLERLSELFRSTLSLHTLLRSTVDELNIHLQPSQITIITLPKNNQTTQFISINTSFSLSENTLFNLKKLVKIGKIISRDQLDEGPAKDLLRQTKLEIVIPLTVKENLHGFLLLGPKASGSYYSIQDLNVLEILAPQLSIAVQNALSYEEISRFNDTLKAEVDKATADLQRANRHLKHLDKLKDEFVFIATHELKNPVTAMRGYLSMLKEGIYGPIPANMQEALDQLTASNQQLVDLVNDLLQIARSEAQTITVHTKPLILPPIVQSVIQSLMPLAIQKHLNLTYSTFPQSLPEVLADDQRIKEILNNLISNAIKYSDHGTITISHELRSDSVITHVKDEGVGISAADQKKLFTRFYRVEEEVAKGIPGTGLGLFIVKQLLEKMGGRIWVNSEKGVGSTFSFSLPIV